LSSSADLFGTRVALLVTRQPSSNNIANEEATMNATRKSGNDCPAQLAEVEPIGPGKKEAPLEKLAADLTDVAYQVALRHGLGEKWLEVHLDLWKALTAALEKHSSLDQEIQLPYDPSLDVD
jgi:hypothetical protein